MLSQGAQQVNDAFAQFTPDYFNNYATQYMAKVNDQLKQQQDQATKQLAFGLARQGISDSQAGLNQSQLLTETAGRTLADQTTQAQQQAAQLQAQTASAKQNLLGQVQGAESIGSPIAGSTEQDVNASLDTQRSAISGITSGAGDVAASLTAVPPVSPLGDVFSGLVTSGGSLLQGLNANQVAAAAQRGYAGAAASEAGRAKHDGNRGQVMCVDPATAAAIGSVVVSAAGTVMQSNAQQKQSAAIGAQNQTLANEQNAAFEQRIQAGFQQTAAQTAAQQQTLNDRAAAAAQTGTQQMAALKQYQDTLNAENTQAASLRSTGDTAAQALLAQTSAPNLAAAQASQQAQAAALLAGQPQGGQGPQVTDPSGENAVSNDPTQRAAAARSAAEAATNIRNYGAKVAAVNSYDAPVQQVGLAIANNQTGIMPAQAANQLLQSGSNTLLLPTQTAYAGATARGQTLDTLIQSQGQSALDAAGLSYGNATDLANLQQSDVDTIAKNKLAQQTADIGGQAAIGAGISSLGNMGLRAYGQFGGAPLNAKISSLFGTGTPSGATS